MRVSGKDILKRTLVVFGCSDSQFLPFQESVEETGQELGYKTIRPKNVKELADSINSLKPMLLIFDTHGGYDGGSHESSVQIGEDYLSPDEVMRLNISAPLIFMSACTTAPLYNLTKTIVNSFIAAGAFAVTASYMPLSINEASVTYMRLLNQLKVAATKCIHKNWLSFIPYVLRTSAIHESFLDLAHPDKSDDATHDIHANTINEAFQFKGRRDVYNRLRKGITFGNRKISFDKHVPNYLMYTTVGRADLIDFEVSRDAIYKALGISNPE